MNIAADLLRIRSRTFRRELIRNVMPWILGIKTPVQPGNWPGQEPVYARGTMSYVIEVLRQEHCNIESLLCVLERELSVFDRGDRPNCELVLAAIDYFKDYPDSCHHPKEDMIFEALKDESTRTFTALQKNRGSAS